jgi:hypothetical protein
VDQRFVVGGGGGEVDVAEAMSAEENRESLSSSSDHLIHHPVILASRYSRALRKHLFLQCKANYGGESISKSSLGGNKAQWLTKTRHSGLTP